MNVLRGYAWPGNVGELANLIERLTVIKPSGFVEVADLPWPVLTPGKLPIRLHRQIVYPDQQPSDLGDAEILIFGMRLLIVAAGATHTYMTMHQAGRGLAQYALDALVPEDGEPVNGPVFPGR